MRRGVVGGADEQELGVDHGWPAWIERKQGRRKKEGSSEGEVDGEVQVHVQTLLLPAGNRCNIAKRQLDAGR